MKIFPVLVAVLPSVALLGCGGPVEDDTEDFDEDAEELGEDTAAFGGGGDDDDDDDGIGKIKAKGGFTCDFSILGDAFGPADIAPAIERDRMIMSDGNGMYHKHLPIALDFEHFSNGQPDLFSGGRYLFKKEKDARDYRDYVENDMILDGDLFLERPYFYGAECYDWKVAGARNFTPVDTTQVIMRTERFELTGNVNHAINKVKDAWEDIEDEAEVRGFAAAWVLYNKDERLASVVYFHDRVVPYDPNVPDFESLGYVSSIPPLGATIADEGFPRVFDRTHWVLTIWKPFVSGDHGDPSLWPHSPPFGLPFCGDNVCEVSRGEEASTCAVDCPSKCGNGICQPNKGENDLNCPGDCNPTNSCN